jgi:DNA-binding NtrC family response regulator
MGTDDQILQFSSARHLAPAKTASADSGTDFSLSGSSTAINQLRAQIRRVAPYYRTASLSGELGCGDEAVARALHDMGPMHEREFIAFHAAEAEERFASGHLPAEITMAGVLYLAEAEQLSRAAQDGVLRLLRMQNSRSARVVAFVGKGLKPLISAGFFSTELAGALGSLRILLPALRERAADIPTLLQQYIDQQHAANPPHLTPEFLTAATRFLWPENLPQLREAADWLLVHRTGETVDAEDLNAAVNAMSGQPGKPAGPRLVRLEQVAQEHIRSVLMACNGNKLRAAEVLGISRSTLYRMLDCPGAPDSFLMTG